MSRPSATVPYGPDTQVTTVAGGMRSELLNQERNFATNFATKLKTPKLLLIPRGSRQRALRNPPAFLDQVGQLGRFQKPWFSR
jgi:hypothetical protein